MNTTGNKNSRINPKFLYSEEGHVFMLGSCMLILWVSAIAFLWRWEHAIWSDLVAMGLVHIPAGRAVSVAYGIQAGLHPALAAVLAIYLDVMCMFIIYPILVFSYKNLFERRFFKDHMMRMFESAQKSVTRFRRYKIIGVFLFVWFPFWMTGVIGGAILGFLLGLKTWVNLTTVILGTSSAVLCWAYISDNLLGWLGKIHEGVPLAIILVAVLVAAIMRIVSSRKEEKKP